MRRVSLPTLPVILPRTPARPARRRVPSRRRTADHSPGTPPRGMPGAGQPVAVSFGCVESTPTVAFLHGTYEPAAVPVNHRLALRERRRAKAARAAKLA